MREGSDHQKCGIEPRNTPGTEAIDWWNKPEFPPTMLVEPIQSLATSGTIESSVMGFVPGTDIILPVKKQLFFTLGTLLPGRRSHHPHTIGIVNHVLVHVEPGILAHCWRVADLRSE